MLICTQKIILTNVEFISKLPKILEIFITNNLGLVIYKTHEIKIPEEGKIKVIF